MAEHRDADNEGEVFDDGIFVLQRECERLRRALERVDELNGSWRIHLLIEEALSENIAE